MLLIHHMDDIEEEFRLAQRLKNLCCDASGTEIDSEKTANIICRIGVIYIKSEKNRAS